MEFNKEIDVVIKNCKSIAIDLGSDHLSSYHFLIALSKTDNFPNEIFKNRNWNF